MSQIYKRAIQYLEIVRAVIFSGILGGNLASIFLANHPRDAMSYIQYSLFGWRIISKRSLPIRQLHDFIKTPEEISIEFLPNTGFLTNWDANYAKDMIYLALMTKTLSPEIVFEIGTLHGYSALLFAMNSTPTTKVYTLDLPPKNLQKPLLSTT